MTTQVRVLRDTTALEYQGLLRAVKLVASHPDFPGKREAVEECVGDLVERSRQGRLTPVQRSELMTILLARGELD